MARAARAVATDAEKIPTTCNRMGLGSDEVQTLDSEACVDSVCTTGLRRTVNDSSGIPNRSLTSQQGFLRDYELQSCGHPRTLDYLPRCK